MPTTQLTRAEAALSDLINVPDVVLIALAKSPAYVASLLGTSRPFSDPVFTHLYTTVSSHIMNMSKLAGRPLSPYQLDLVLRSETRPLVLEALLDYNVPPPEAIRAAKFVHTTETLYYAVDERIYNYYSHNIALMKDLIPILHDATTGRLIASGHTSCSDYDLLAALRTQLAKLDRHATALNALDLEGLLHRRPHLVPTLATEFRTNETLAPVIANSRFLANPTVFRTLTGFTQEELRNAAARQRVPLHIRDELDYNVFGPYGALSLGLNPPGVFPLSPDLSTCESIPQLTYALRNALASHQPFAGRRKLPWDVVALSANPLLAGLEEEGSGAKWDGFILNVLNEATSWSELGPRRVSAAIATIRSRFDYVAEAENYPWSIKVAPSDSVLPRNQLPRKSVGILDLEGPIKTAFIADGFLKDVTPLLPLLGDSPSAWHGFLSALDYASPETSVKKVATTTLAAAS